VSTGAVPPQVHPGHTPAGVKRSSANEVEKTQTVEEMLFNLAVSRQPAPPPFGALPAAARPAPLSAPLTAPLPPSVGRGDSQPPTGGLLNGCVVVGDSQPPRGARGGAATPTEAREIAGRRSAPYSSPVVGYHPSPGRVDAPPPRPASTPGRLDHLDSSVSPVLSPNIARPAAAGAGANDWGSGSGRGSGNGRGRGSGSGGGDSSGGGGVALPSSTRTAAQVQQQRLQQMRNSHRP